MALPLGKLTILVGAGIVGSVLAGEQGISKTTNFFSGAFKIFFKHIKQDDYKDDVHSTSKPRNDLLIAQVNSLRKELQLLASSRPVTIISGKTSGASTVGMPIVVIVIVGYGYVWWKGIKPSELMFATRRSLSDASSVIANRLEQISSAMAEAKRHLFSRVDRAEKIVDESMEITTTARDDVKQMRGDVQGCTAEIESHKCFTRTLEMKMGRIEAKQDRTHQVAFLCRQIIMTLKERDPEFLQGVLSSSLRPALELPPEALIARTTSLPTATPAVEQSSPFSSSVYPRDLTYSHAAGYSGRKALPSCSLSPDFELLPVASIPRTTSLPTAGPSVEQSSPCSSSLSPRVLPYSHAGGYSGLKEMLQISDVCETASETSMATNEVAENMNAASVSSRFGWKLSIPNPFGRTQM